MQARNRPVKQNKKRNHRKTKEGRQIAESKSTTKQKERKKKEDDW